MELTLEQLYQKMRQEMGPSGWWPADSKAEIIIGAIMIQNTNWQNAARAVPNFRQASEFLPARIQRLSLEQIQDLTRPAGFTATSPRQCKRSLLGSASTGSITSGSWPRTVTSCVISSWHCMESVRKLPPSC